MSRLSRFLVVLGALAALLPVDGAAAASFSVTTTANAGPGSLRAAIEAANIIGGPNAIQIQATGTIGLESALPTIAVPVEITGPGAGSLTVERAAGAFRIFDFAGGGSSLSGVTVRGGVAGPGVGTPATGAGILNETGNLTLTRVVVANNEAVFEGGTSGHAEGGGIFSQGPLTLRESLVYANRALVEGASVESVASGGGLQSVGPLTVERSTIAQNAAAVFAGGGSRAEASGGGVLASGGPATIEESTITSNGVAANEAADLTLARGGGIQGGGIAITGSTLFANFAKTDGSAVSANIAVGSNLQSSATSVVRDTIISTPAAVAASCDGAISSGGFNLDDGHSCGFGLSSDQTDVPAGLDPELEDNGGPTPTLALLAGSPAIDRGNAFGASTDQRGLLRPSDFPTISDIEGGDGSDIGAFELQAPPAPQSPSPGVAVVSLVAGDRTPPNTRILRGPSRVTFDRLAKFHFNSTEAQSTFQCKIDKRAWRGCRSPYKRRVSAGSKHLFRVRAIDRFGNVDPTPARFGWRVKALGR